MLYTIRSTALITNLIFSAMKKFLLSAIILTMIPLGSTLWGQESSRKPCTTTGTNCPCTHGKVELLMRGDGNIYEADYTGYMSLDCIDTGTTSGGLWWWKHRSTAFEVTGTEATLGTVHVYLDESRTQMDSYLTS